MSRLPFECLGGSCNTVKQDFLRMWVETITQDAEKSSYKLSVAG